MATSNTVKTIPESNEQAYYEPNTRSWTMVNVVGTDEVEELKQRTGGRTSSLIA